MGAYRLIREKQNQSFLKPFNYRWKKKNIIHILIKIYCFT